MVFDKYGAFFDKCGVSFRQSWGNFRQMRGKFSTDRGRFLNVFRQMRDCFDKHGISFRQIRGSKVSTNRNILFISIFRQFFLLLSTNQNAVLCNYLIFN